MICSYRLVVYFEESCSLIGCVYKCRIEFNCAMYDDVVIRIVMNQQFKNYIFSNYSCDYNIFVYYTGMFNTHI